MASQAFNPYYPSPVSSRCLHLTSNVRGMDQIMSPLLLTGALSGRYSFPMSSSERVILKSESDMFRS